jgi:biopolymer transport protein ExbD
MARTVKRFDEINITPLTDIFLVLLIIMMVVAPAMNQEKLALKLPRLTYGQSVNTSLITVEIDAQGQPSLQGEPLELADLSTRLRDLLPTVTDAKVVIRADEQTENAAVLNAMNAVAATGIERIVFAGEADAAPAAQPDVETAIGEPLPIEGANE